MNRSLPENTVVDFHGEYCPDIVLGHRAVGLVIEQLTIPGPFLALAESRSCAVDALQLALGTTVGNGRLLIDDNGRLHFTVWPLDGEAGLRMETRADGPGYPSGRENALAALIANGTAASGAAEEWAELSRARAERISEADAGELFVWTRIDAPAPAALRAEPYEPCMTCGVPARRNRLFVHDGRTMCPPCHLASHHGVLPTQHPRDPLPRTYEDPDPEIFTAHAHSHSHSHGH